jgi:hypothetical protein
MALKDRNTKITPEQWRQQAADARRRSFESFERSDTDGFLSQWASDTVAREYDAWASLAENGYKAEFDALFDLDGNLLDAFETEGKFGMYWLIRKPGGGVEFFTASSARKGATRLKNDRRKGYTVGTVLMDAYVKLTGSMMSCGPSFFPVPDADREPLTPVSSFYGVDY